MHFLNESLTDINVIEERVKEHSTVSADGEVLRGGLHSSDIAAGINESMRERMKSLEREGYITADDVRFLKDINGLTDEEAEMLSILTGSRLAVTRIGHLRRES